jgi:chorismate mutase
MKRKDKKTSNLQNLRKSIDSVDKKLVELIIQRVQTTAEITEIKKRICVFILRKEKPRF